MIISVLVWRKSIHSEDMRENDFYIFVPSDFDLWPLDLKFASLVTLFQSYVFTKLEVSKAFLFRENSSYGTDGRVATLNAADCGPMGGRIENDRQQATKLVTNYDDIL